MITLRQSPFELFERLEQQVATAERVPHAEILEAESTYTVRLELPGVDHDSIDIKATDRNLVISAERPFHPGRRQPFPSAQRIPHWHLEP
jgi:HSP20 family protein